MSLLAWLRRLTVSLGVGVTSYAIMLGIMLASVLFDREAEPVITAVSNAGRSIVSGFDQLVSGSHWGQVAVNHLRERVNMTHVLLSIPAVLIASVVVGIPLNKVLGGTRTALQRVAIALTSVPATVVLAVVLFSFNAMFPGTYASLLRFADWVWQLSLDALSASGDSIPGARKLTNVARQGFTGHHYVIMAMCSVAASFLVNVVFALAFRGRHDEPLPHEVPSSYA
jgi:hypothetical protein